MERKAGHTEGRQASARESAIGRGLPYLFELEPEIRAAAIVDRSGEVVDCLLAGSRAGELSDPAEFGPAAVRLLDVVDDAGGKPFDSCHISSSDSEVFMVREGGFSLVAVTERFVLASLMAFDMRMTLRDLSGGSTVA